MQLSFEKSKKSSGEEMNDILNKLPTLYRYFQKIDVKNLNIQGNKIDISYDFKQFYIDTKYLKINAKLIDASGGLQTDISSMVFKDFNLTMQGEAIGSIKDEMLYFKGTFSTFNIDGNVTMHINNRILHYDINTNNFASLTPFMDSLSKKVKLNRHIGDWIYKKIVAKNYTLHSLSGMIDLKNGYYYPSKMRGSAIANNVKIKFHPKVPPANIDKLYIKLKNNRLYFDMKNGVYQGLKLKKSDAFIYNILTKGSGIILHINANAPLNEDIQKILHAYHLHIPIVQKSGKVDTKLTLNIHFLPFDIVVDGKFKAEASNILLQNAPFSTDGAEIVLKNKILEFKDISLKYKDILDINTSGVLDLVKFDYNGSAYITNLNIEANKQNFIHIKDIKMPLLMQITTEDLSIFLPKLKSELRFANDENIILSHDISKIYDDSAFMQQKHIFDGNFTLRTKNFADYAIDAHITKMKSLFMINNIPLTGLQLNAKISKNDINITTSSNILTIQATKDEEKIHIQNADILLDTKQPDTDFSHKHLQVTAKNSNIIFTDLHKTILSDSLKATMFDKNITIHSRYKDSKYHFNLTKDRILMQADDVNSAFINTFFRKNIFKGGKFDMKLSGLDMKTYSGYIQVKDSFARPFKFYNNLLAFLNSIPSLIAFKAPGFNENGYSIKNAKMLVTRKEDKITIHAINVDGVDADISGNGTIDLKDNKMDINLKLKTFKAISDALKHIPVVNYILLGKDKSIQTAIHVGGTLNDPDIQTQTLKDTLFIPFDIIIRTITLPFNLTD